MVACAPAGHGMYKVTSQGRVWPYSTDRTWPLPGLPGLVSLRPEPRHRCGALRHGRGRPRQPRGDPGFGVGGGLRGRAGSSSSGAGRGAERMSVWGGRPDAGPVQLVRAGVRGDARRAGRHWAAPAQGGEPAGLVVQKAQMNGGACRHGGQLHMDLFNWYFHLLCSSAFQLLCVVVGGVLVMLAVAGLR